jgi:uncharacterized protein (DUF697 family)
MTSYAQDTRAVSPLTEDQEVELASELMDVGSDAELEQFLGSIISGIARDAGRFLKSPAGHALSGILTGVAKKALPMVGGALGSVVAPGIGTAVGSQLGSIASNLFEMELGPMPEEEAEFEVSRRLVQLMAAAAYQAVQAPPQPGVSPKAAAWDAVLRAARQYAPGMYQQLTQRPGRGGTGVGQNTSAGAEEQFGRFGARVSGGGWSGARGSGGGGWSGARGSGGGGWSGARGSGGGGWSGVRGSGGGANPGGLRMPAPRQGRGSHQGFRQRHGRGRPAGGGFGFGGPVVGGPVVDGSVVDEPVFGGPAVDQPVFGEPVVSEPVVEEPILPAWDPTAGPGGQANLEVGDPAASGTWERRGRHIILREG